MAEFHVPSAKRTGLRHRLDPLRQKWKLDLLEGTANIKQWKDRRPGNKTDKMTTAFEEDTVLCPHCGAEPIDDDDLCRFCGKVMVPLGSVKSTSKMVSSGLRSLKAKIRPMTTEEHKDIFEETTFNLSNPADPIWDE